MVRDHQQCFQFLVLIFVISHVADFFDYLHDKEQLKEGSRLSRCKPSMAGKPWRWDQLICESGNLRLLVHPMADQKVERDQKED